jgi:hypothetical protein
MIKRQSAASAYLNGQFTIYPTLESLFCAKGIFDGDKREEEQK